MKKKKVMIVDDEEDFLKLTKLNLEETGKYEVMTLSDAVGLIAQVHSFKPDIILLDVLMPAIGGIDACMLLNNDPIARKIPIIIVSALDKHKNRVQAYKAGVMGYVTKPIDVDDLIAEIEKALLRQTDK